MNTKVYLIGLAGKARSGKDTMAGFIKEWAEDYSFGFSQDAFARRLKESAAAALGLQPEEGQDRVPPEDAVAFCEMLKRDDNVIHVVNAEGTGYTITGREFLQYYGTEAHRDVFGDNFWVDAVLPKGWDPSGITPKWHESFKIAGRVSDFAVVTDVRFPNEARRVKELGGEVWKIEREGSGAGDHLSEQELDMELIDYVIGNNGTLDELHESVDVILERLTGIAIVSGTTED
jgi:hypothetical protein